MNFSELFADKVTNALLYMNYNLRRQSSPSIAFTAAFGVRLKNTELGPTYRIPISMNWYQNRTPPHMNTLVQPIQ